MILWKIRLQDQDNPWLTYRLAAAEIALDRPRGADDAFRQLLARQSHNPEARYAHGLYLANEDRDSEVLATLGQVPAAAWTDNMRELDTRIKRRQLLARAEQLRNAGHEPGVHRENGKNRTISPADSLQALALWRSCLDKGKSGQLRRKRLIYRGPLRTSPPDPRATNVDVYSPRAA